MQEFRFHGRGGQGAVTSADILAISAIAEGRFAQAFPSFGPERRGAPVQAFARISDDPILNRSRVYSPVAVIVLDSSLLSIVDVTSGLNNDGWLIVSTTHSPEDIRGKTAWKGHLAIVDGLSISMNILKKPIVNTVMLGALLKVMNLFSLDNIFHTVDDRFGKISQPNKDAMLEAYESVSVYGKLQ